MRLILRCDLYSGKYGNNNNNNSNNNNNNDNSNMVDSSLRRSNLRCAVCCRAVHVTAVGLVRVHGPVGARCAGSR